MEMLRFLEQLHRRAHVQLVVDFAQVADRRRLVVVLVRHAAFLRLFHFRHIGDQHRVVRGHRTAALGDDARRGQAELFAGIGQRLHDVAGVGMQAVVDRAEAARTGAFIVHAQATAHVDVGDLRAQARQLHEVAGGFAHAVGDVAHVGDLRAHVEVQQVQAVGVLGVTQRLPQIQQLARRQAELGLVATAVLPLAGAQRGQAHAHAQARLHVQRLGLFQHQLQLGRLLDDDEGLQAQLAADQGQADVLAVLVAVADDQPARARQRQHSHQLGLAARFQAEALAVVAGQGAGHAAGLVDLDRVHGRVAAAVLPVLLGLGEGRLQLAQALAEDVREAHQQRQLGARRPRRIDHLGQRHHRAVRPGRSHHHVPGLIHVEVTVRPMRDRVGLAGLVEGPIGHFSRPCWQ